MEKSWRGKLQKSSRNQRNDALVMVVVKVVEISKELRMKKLMFLLLALACGIFNAHAQPSSIGGIVPGKTTLEELKSLIDEPKDQIEAIVTIGPSGLNEETKYQEVILKNLDRKRVRFEMKDGVIYRVELSLYLFPEVAVALIGKYGEPKIKKGAIKEVTCQNKLGASFQRFEGEERLFWRENAGIQACFYNSARNCSEDIYRRYVIEHVATVKAIEAAAALKSVNELSGKVKRVQDGL